MKYLLSIISFALTISSWAIVIVKSSIPCSEIVVSPTSHITEKYAANELQYWFCTVSGGQIPIVNEPSKIDNVKIFIGKNFAKEYATLLEKLEDNDGFAVRNSNRGKQIYIFGAKPKGTLNGVYEFIEQNTDLIWARPELDIGTIYTPQPILNVKKLSLFSIPKSHLRAWSQYATSPVYDTMWQTRHKFNYFGRKSSISEKIGCLIPGAGGGHSLFDFINPKKYFKDHPEYYALRDGKRTFKDCQLCFLAYEMLPEYIKNLRADIDSLNGVKSVNISIADTQYVCCCPRCLEPLKLEDGRTISPADPAFRSAQFFLFLNKIANELAKTHPHLEIITYAYFFTEVPPPFKLSPNISVYYCPYNHDYKYSFDSNRNETWKKVLATWGAVTSKAQLREYYGDTAAFPRPLEDVVQKDLQFCLKNNINRFSSEIPPDSVKQWPRTKAAWDISAMTFWVISKLYWDPNQDVDKLRDYYLKRTYREGAPAMKRFYEIIRKNYYSDNIVEVYDSAVVPLAKYYICDKGDELNCRLALIAAEQMAQHPKSKELIRRHRARFEEWMSEAKKLSNISLRIPLVKGKNLDKDFSSSLWKNGVSTGLFRFAGKSERPKIKTSAKLLHDGTTLYIRFTANANDMKTLKGNPVRNDGREIMPRGDHFEIFLGASDEGLYRHFGFDSGNQVIYDAKIFDASWQAPWYRTIQKLEDKWEAIVAIPFSACNFKYQKGNIMRGMLYRSKYFTDNTTDPKTGKAKIVREQTVWGGQGRVHLMQSFGTFIFE